MAPIGNRGQSPSICICAREILAYEYDRIYFPAKTYTLRSITKRARPRPARRRSSRATLRRGSRASRGRTRSHAPVVSRSGSGASGIVDRVPRAITRAREEDRFVRAERTQAWSRSVRERGFRGFSYVASPCGEITDAWSPPPWPGGRASGFERYK